MYELRSFSANRRHRDLTAARMFSCQLTILPASFDLYLLFFFFEVCLSWVRIPPGIAQRCLPCTTGDLLFPIRSGGGRGRGRGIVSNFVIMGRAPCCDKANVKRGPWSPEEDATLKSYVQLHGTGGNWIALPHKAGLRRCGKSCRLRWLNYLRPDIKHGGFTEEEDNVICSLYGSIGSRWSIIAAQLPGRTDNDIKNYWNTRLKKKLLGKCKDQRTARRLNSAAGGGAKQMESVLSASASPASSVSAPAHDDHMSSSAAAAAFSYSDLDPAGIAPSVNVEQSSSPLTKMSAAAFANTQEKYAFEGSALANMLLTTTVGDDYSLTKGINYTIPPAALASQNASIGHILSPSSWDIHAGQPHEDAQNMYEVAKVEPSPPVLDQNGWPAASMALWESCCSASRGTNYTESSWLNGLAAPDDPHHAALACESLTPAELNEILYCNGSLMHPKEEPTDYYALQNGFIRDADAAYCNTSSPKSSVTCCPNYSDNYILLGSATDEGITSQGVFHEGGVNY